MYGYIIDLQRNINDDIRTVNIPFSPTRLRLNEATTSATDADRPGINSLEEIKQGL